MARKKGKPARRSSAWEAPLKAGASVIAGLVDRFGWPGALIVLGYTFVVSFASLEQKRELIQKYLITPEVPDGIAWVVSTGIFLVVLVYQRLVYKQRIAIMEVEMKRLAAWKSEHQKAILDTEAASLHSSDPARN